MFLEETLACITRGRRTATPRSINYKFLQGVPHVPQNMSLSLESFFNLFNQVLAFWSPRQSVVASALKMSWSLVRGTINQATRNSSVCTCDECYHSFCMFPNPDYEACFPGLGKTTDTKLTIE